MRNAYQTASGKKVVRKCRAMFVYFPWLAQRPDEPMETAVDATGICNDLALCTMDRTFVKDSLLLCDSGWPMRLGSGNGEAEGKNTGTAGVV